MTFMWRFMDQANLFDKYGRGRQRVAEGAQGTGVAAEGAKGTGKDIGAGQ